MRIILNHIDSSVSGPTFIREHCYHPRDFSWQRSLSFLSGAVPSLQFGIDKLFRGLGDEASVTKQAVSKACQKFPYEALASLQQQAVNTFHAVQAPRRWMGYRLVAVDGTKIRLPLNDDLADEFGTQGNQTQTRRPMALLVSHQDVLTRVPLSCELSPVYMGERFLAERLFSGLQTDDLAIYDRGFPSFALFAAHRHAQMPFCARVTLNFTTQVIQFVASGDTETMIQWTPSATMRSDCVALEVCDQPLTLRLIRVDLSQGHIEILATSLLDTKTHPAHLFKSVYAERLDLFQWISQDQETIHPGRSNPRKSKYINPLPGVVA